MIIKYLINVGFLKSIIKTTLLCVLVSRRLDFRFRFDDVVGFRGLASAPVGHFRLHTCVGCTVKYQAGGALHDVHTGTAVDVVNKTHDEFGAVLLVGENTGRRAEEFRVQLSLCERKNNN